MSRRTSRLENQRAKKDRRMKMIAVGGAVLLAGILAFELPHYLGGSKSPSAAGTTSASAGSTTSTTTTTPGTTTPGVAAAVLPTGSTQLPNSDVAPLRTKSQLYSFDRFAGKDPFVQQVSPQTAAAGSSSGGSASGSSGGSGSSGSSKAQQASTRTLASQGVATISVNGKSEAVRVGAGFPSANPVFTLVSLSKGAANIGIANGSYTSGAQTVRLTGSRTLTLVDTADGIHYKLRLLSAS